MKLEKITSKEFKKFADNHPQITFHQTKEWAELKSHNNWEAYYLKGRALINLERYDEAIDELINSLALNEDNVDARIYIAKAAHLKGDLNYSLQVYDSVLNIDEKSFEALNGKALVYFDKKDFIEADKFFKKAAQVSILPEDSKIKWNFAAAKLKEE